MMEETPSDRLSADPSALWVSYGHTPSGASPRPPAPSSSRAARRAPEGYAYIFPKRDHVNVGIGYLLDHFRREVRRRPYDLQHGLVDDLRHRGVVSGNSVPANFTPFIIPVGGPLRRPGRGRVLLAGDAGGFVNGFTAEGIYYAMVSGEQAARAVISVPAAGVVRDLEPRYRRAWRREIGAELRDSVLLQRHLFADRRRIARVIAAAGSNPKLTTLVLDYAIGRLPYAAVRRRVLAAAPGVAVSLFLQFLRGALLPEGAVAGAAAAPPDGR
jgi:flavin-dependent dehydrogenase